MNATTAQSITIAEGHACKRNGIVHRFRKSRRFPKACIALLLCVLMIAWGATSGKAQTVVPIDMSDQQQVIQRALRLTQLDLVSKKFVAKEIILEKSWLPFLSAEVDGKAAWQIECDEGALKLKSISPEYLDNYPRKFVILLDRKSGRIISVESGVEDQSRKKSAAASIASAKYLTELSVRYIGLPDEDPKVTFMDALDAGVVASPYFAKEIEGFYVMVSRGGSTPRPCWVIILRGVPESETLRGQNNDYLCNVRQVIDATTGKCLDAQIGNY